MGGGIETADLAGMDEGKAEVSSYEVEGMRFTNTNGPKRDIGRGPQAAPKIPSAKAAPLPTVALKPEVRLAIAKSLCADFPESYDFEAPARKKLARIMADFEDRHDVIRAIYAAETDEMKALLAAEFPKAFGQ